MIGTSKMRCRGALRGIEADFGPEHADTYRRDLRADVENCECRSAKFELN